MDDLISRQAVITGLASIAKAKAKSDAQKAMMGRAMFFIEQLPPTIPQPKQGEWIMHIDDLFPCESTQECSVCHAEQLINGNDDNFCQNCGTIMEGGEKYEKANRT